MKIAIVGSAHPLRGGLAAFNERLAQQLVEEGHEVTIFSFSLQYPNFLFPGKTQYTTESAPALDIRPLLNSVNPLSWVRTGMSIRQGHFDLIIIKYWLPFMGPAFGTLLRVARMGRNTRVVCIVDNIIPHEKRPGDSAFTKYFIKGVDAFVTMSREVLADVKKFTNKPAYFTPHPVYDLYGFGISGALARAHLQLEGRGRYILFFGFIRKYKGLDLLLEAMADERIRALGIRLIVAGEYYDDPAPYNEIISKHALQDTVHLFTDFVPNSDVRYYFSAADLVVQPYRHATQSGITQIAYHFEKPMVVTDVGGLAEVVPDGKVGFVAAPDASSIAEAIVKFYTPGSLPSLAHHMQEEKKKYTWATFVQSVLHNV